MRKFACIVEISTKVMVSYFFNVHPVVWLFTRQRNVTDSLLRLLFTAAVMAKIDDNNLRHCSISRGADYYLSSQMQNLQQVIGSTW